MEFLCIILSLADMSFWGLEGDDSKPELELLCLVSATASFHP
jgi:hypothetical protein